MTIAKNRNLQKSLFIILILILPSSIFTYISVTTQNPLQAFASNLQGGTQGGGGGNTTNGTDGNLGGTTNPFGGSAGGSGGPGGGSGETGNSHMVVS